ncbi:MAG: hypothetical protein PVJ50_09090, partial [Desulfobacterales bacterium]
GREIRAETIRFKAIRTKIILDEFIYAAQIIAGPMIKANSLKHNEFERSVLPNKIRKNSQRAMRHTAPITTENINVPPMPISKASRGMATKAVIHRFKCMLIGLSITN